MANRSGVVTSVQIPHDLKMAAKAAAAAEGRTLTEVINAYLRRYVAARGVTATTPPGRP